MKISQEKLTVIADRILASQGNAKPLMCELVDMEKTVELALNDVGLLDRE